MAIHLAELVLGAELKVVLVGPSAQHPTVARMRDELTVLGVDVEFVALSNDTRDLPEVARRRGAAAVARVESSPPEIVLWIDPARGAGDPTSTEFHVSESLHGPIEPGLLPLRAVELLRGRLIPLPQEPQREAGNASPDALSTGPEDAKVEGGPPLSAAPSGSPTPPPVAPRLPPRAAEPPGRLSLHLSAAVLLSPGGVPATPEVRFGAAWSLLSRLDLDAVAFLPTSGSTVEAPEGNVDLRILDFGAGFRGTLTDPAANLSIAMGLGLGAMLLLFEGDASEPFISAKGRRWVPSPYTSITARYHLHPRFALRADILATLTRPEPVVRIADREVASFGQPAVFLSLGIEVRP
jgi:hypothetical protein